MEAILDTFSSRQIMRRERLEFFHYRDVTIDRIQPHTHSHFEFYFFLGGETRYNVGDESFYLKRGDFLIIRPGTLHFPDVKFTDENAAYERFVIWASNTYVNELSLRDKGVYKVFSKIATKNLCHFRPDTTNKTMILNILEDMKSEMREQDVGYQIAIESLFMQLMIMLCRVINKRNTFKQEETQSDLYSSIIRYIHNNIKEPLSIDDLCGAFYVSRSYVSRIVKEHLNTSVHQYILKVKLEHALSKIYQGSSITEASEEYGFDNYSTFYRECKKFYNKSPRELMKDNRI
ncbi:MAG: AraC family transcriptional regulator [Lachnospiraceae bacterium]|nr:AraC family transcriptional regulator [Lachnospiraceae bacterium]